MRYPKSHERTLYVRPDGRAPGGLESGCHVDTVASMKRGPDSALEVGTALRHRRVTLRDRTE
jgi:hypothetical protein